MEPVAVDLDPLLRARGLGEILRYERLAGIPWYRRLVVVFAGLIVAATAIGAGLVWLKDAAAPVLTPIVAGYGVLGAAAFVWFTIEVGRRASIAFFAWANGWAYADTLERTGRTGSAFTRVRRSRERTVVACDDPRMPFQLGRHYSVARNGDEAATVQRPFAFIELPLPTSVPNIVLRNRRRSIIPSLGFGQGNAKLELEGDFASRFLLFVPQGYERDALYIFTPDLMARVMDLGGGAEIELSGDRLYVYLPHSTRFDRPETMSAALVLAEEFHRRFAKRTGGYRDGQVDAATAGAGGLVGLRGQRLAGRGTSVLAVAGAAAIMVFSGASIALTLFGAF